MIVDQLQWAGQVHITRVLEKYWETQDSNHMLELLQLRGVHIHNPGSIFVW